jgi:hypothetical protein
VLEAQFINSTDDEADLAGRWRKENPPICKVGLGLSPTRQGELPTGQFIELQSESNREEEQLIDYRYYGRETEVIVVQNLCDHDH